MNWVSPLGIPRELSRVHRHIELLGVLLSPSSCLELCWRPGLSCFDLKPLACSVLRRLLSAVALRAITVELSPAMTTHWSFYVSHRRPGAVARCVDTLGYRGHPGTEAKASLSPALA